MGSIVRSLRPNGFHILVALQQCYCRLRELNIRITTFNQSTASIILVYRHCILGTSIVCGFAAIEMYHHNLPLAILNLIILISSVVVSNLMYGDAFKVPRSIKRIKNELVNRLKRSKMVSPEQRAILSRAVSSIPVLGIRSGRSQYLKRTSTPKFMNICVRCILRVGISYRSSPYRLQ